MKGVIRDALISFGLPEHSVDGKKFRYMILSRCQSDCEYFLGNGNGYEGHSWALETRKHLSLMQTLYDSFSEKDKPEWITQKKLDFYKAEMPKRKRAAAV